MIDDIKNRISRIEELLDEIENLRREDVDILRQDVDIIRTELMMAVSELNMLEGILLKYKNNTERDEIERRNDIDRDKLFNYLNSEYIMFQSHYEREKNEQVKAYIRGVLNTIRRTVDSINNNIFNTN